MKPYQLFVPGLAACTAVSGATRLDQMDQGELEAYAARTAALVAAVADVALEEGDITPNSVAVLATALHSIAAGSTAPVAGSILKTLDLKGYGALALTIAITEIDAALEERGAFQDGFLSDNGKFVVNTISAELARVAQGG